MVGPGHAEVRGSVRSRTSLRALPVDSEAARKRSARTGDLTGTDTAGDLTGTYTAQAQRLAAALSHSQAAAGRGREDEAAARIDSLSLSAGKAEAASLRPQPAMRSKG